MAKKSSGQFLLRIEDTDKSRTVPGALDGILDVLEWTKLKPDKPYVQQSKRLALYQGYAEELVASGRAYKCYCSKERLDALKASGHGYDRACRNAPEMEGSYVVRLRVPKDAKQTVFQDSVYGYISVDHSAIDDAILMKSDGYPTYHFANVIDDHESEVNLVMRGQEWLPSTPLHVQLYDIFGWRRPQFAHLPLLVRNDGTKLSKRHGDACVESFRERGYLPGALLNFVAFLGWSPSRLEGSELMSLEQLVGAFSLEGLNKAESRVDLDKLDWFNRHYLENVDLDTAADDLLAILMKKHQELISNAFRPLTGDYLKEVIALIRTRLPTLNSIPVMAPYFFVTPSPNLDPICTAQTRDILATALHVFSEIPFALEHINTAFQRLRAQFPSIKPRDLMLVIRMAITGTNVGASLADTLRLLGKDECLHRLKRAV